VSGQQIIPPRRKPVTGQRRRSMRYYLAHMGRYRKLAEEGVLSTADAARFVSMVKEEAAVHLVMQQLELAGQGEPIVTTPAPEEDYQPAKIKPHRTKTVSVKQGTDRHGLPFEERSVSIQSNTRDVDAEIDAQIEALT
jgi:hypothetical protein